MSQKIIGCENMVSLNNTLGTCWNIAILAILFYSNKTGPEVQNKLKLPSYLSAMEHATNLVNESEQQLREFIPSYINFDEKKKDIIFFIKYVIERFNTKINIDFDLSYIILNTYSNHLFHKIHLEKPKYYP